jgi:hypothetical protein
MRQTPSQSDARRRGSAYVVILAVSLILLIIGLSAATVARVHSRALAADNDWAEAQRLAFSGTEHALSRIESTADWRTTIGGTEVSVPFGRGSFHWRLVDEQDGLLGDDPTDPFVIIARGTVNQAAYAVALRCSVGRKALPALGTCLHAGSNIAVEATGKLTAAGAPVSSNGPLTVLQQYSTVIGDVEAQSVSGPGTIQGEITVPAPPKALPQEDVFALYCGMATPIPYSSTIRKEVLSSGLNPWGPPNARGIYYLDAPGKVVSIKDVRIEGTLVVRCTKLMLMEELLIHSPRPDQPALIVDGDVALSYRSKDSTLREWVLNLNLNPPGAPYNGSYDDDTSDEYPSEIRGLVHVKGDLALRTTARVRGAILCEGMVTCDGENEIIHDPRLVETPPMGYTSGPGNIVPESWRRIVE